MNRMTPLPDLIGSPFKGLICDVELDIKRQELKYFSDKLLHRKKGNDGAEFISGRRPNPLSTATQSRPSVRGTGMRRAQLI